MSLYLTSSVSDSKARALTVCPSQKPGRTQLLPHRSCLTQHEDLASKGAQISPSSRLCPWLSPSPSPGLPLFKPCFTFRKSAFSTTQTMSSHHCLVTNPSAAMLSCGDEPALPLSNRPLSPSLALQSIFIICRFLAGQCVYSLKRG